MRPVGLLYPRPPRPALPPEALPIGRAALALAREGILVVIGDHAEGGGLRGERAVPGGWVAWHGPVLAAVDRFPAFSRPVAHAALLEGLGATPVHNPPRLVARVRDKLATHLALSGLDQPEQIVDARDFPAALDAWGAGFLKPRWGSFGLGVRFVRAGERLVARGRVDGVDQPMVLQRAVPAPRGLAGVSLRVLVQRGPDGPLALPAAARTHPTDPVVNHARGADVQPAADRFGVAVDRAARALALAAADRFPDAHELGIDLVLDPDLRPWIIEVNGQPRGRLAELAAAAPERFGALHADAMCRPFRAALGAPGSASRALRTG